MAHMAHMARSFVKFMLFSRLYALLWANIARISWLGGQTNYGNASILETFDPPPLYREEDDDGGGGGINPSQVPQSTCFWKQVGCKSGGDPV